MTNSTIYGRHNAHINVDKEYLPITQRAIVDFQKFSLLNRVLLKIHISFTLKLKS